MEELPFTVHIPDAHRRQALSRRSGEVLLELDYHLAAARIVESRHYGVQGGQLLQQLALHFALPMAELQAGAYEGLLVDLRAAEVLMLPEPWVEELYFPRLQALGFRRVATLLSTSLMTATTVLQTVAMVQGRLEYRTFYERESALQWLMHARG